MLWGNQYFYEIAGKHSLYCLIRLDLLNAVGLGFWREKTVGAEFQWPPFRGSKRLARVAGMDIDKNGTLDKSRLFVVLSGNVRFVYDGATNTDSCKKNLTQWRFDQNSTGRSAQSPNYQSQSVLRNRVGANVPSAGSLERMSIRLLRISVRRNLGLKIPRAD